MAGFGTESVGDTSDGIRTRLETEKLIKLTSQCFAYHDFKPLSFPQLLEWVSGKLNVSASVLGPALFLALQIAAEIGMVTFANSKFIFRTESLMQRNKSALPAK